MRILIVSILFFATGCLPPGITEPKTYCHETANSMMYAIPQVDIDLRGCENHLDELMIVTINGRIVINEEGPLPTPGRPWGESSRVADVLRLILLDEDNNEITEVELGIYAGACTFVRDGETVQGRWRIAKQNYTIQLRDPGSGCGVMPAEIARREITCEAPVCEELAGL